MAIPTEEQTMKMLDKEKKVNIRIKSDRNNPNYVTEAVYVNGVCVRIPVGEDVEVPTTVHELLIRKGII